MSTPLRLAAALAEGHPDARDPTGDDQELFLRDLKWAKAVTGCGDQPRTPHKLRRAIDEASAAASASRAKAVANDDGGSAAPVPRDEGVALRTAVVDAVSHFEALLDDTAFRIARNRKQCNAASTAILEQLRNFDANFKYRQVVGFDVGRLVAETGLKTDLAFQDRYGSAIAVPDSQRYLSVLDLLRKHPYVGREAEEMKRRIQGNVTQPLLPLDDGGLPGLLLSVNQFLKTDVLAALREKMQGLGAELAELERRLTALQHDAKVARDAEDLEVADGLEEKILAVMQRMFEVHVSRLDLVGASEAANSAGMMAQLDAIMKAESLSRVEGQTASINSNATNDGIILDKDRGQRHRNHQQAIANYNAAVQRSTERLERNAFQQDLVWQEVAANLERIDTLRKEAATMVDEHLAMTEKEQKRRKEYSEYQESFAKHREYVRLLCENTSTASSFLGEVREFMQSARQTIVELRVEEKVAAICADERKQLEAQYTNFSGRAARRVHALEVRAASAVRMQNEAQFHHRQAGACDDPDGKQFAARADSLQRDCVRLRDRAKESCDRFERNQDVFTTTMTAFDDFDAENNPAVMAMRLRVSLRDQFATALEALSHAQSDLSSELRFKANEHEQKANAAKLMAEKKRQQKLSPQKSRSRVVEVQADDTGSEADA